MSSTPSKLEIALSYARLGWQVLPLHDIADGICTCHKATCASAGKHPRIMEWVRRATNDEAELTKWWGMWSNANIGIATGHRSGIVVLDVDEKSGGVATLKALNEAYGTQMAGVIAKTGGGGFHVYFKHPGGYWPNTQGSPTMPSPIGQGLDFRGDGGYVAAPGSEHLSGQLYRWVKDCGPGSELAEMPEWLKSKLVKKTSSSVVLPTDEKALVLEGNRHNTLRAWACGMRAKGMSAGAIRAALLAENAVRFAEPKSEEEIERLVAFAGKFEPGTPPAYDFEDQAQADPEADPAQIEAETIIIPGVVSVRDVAAEMDKLYDVGAQRGLSTGWDNLDRLCSWHPGDVIINCAAPSAGKTTLGLNMVANTAKLHGWKTAIASTENRVAPMYADLAGIVMGKTYYGNYPRNQMTREEKGFADEFMYEHFKFMQPVPAEEFSVPNVFEKAVRLGVNALMLDPFGAFSLGSSTRNSTESRVIRDLLHGVVQATAKKYGILVWIFVHTHKLPVDSNGDMAMPNPYNATDSAGFYNAADFFFGQRRPKSKGGKITELENQKVRDRFSGKAGLAFFEFDYKTGRYLDAGLAEDRTAGMDLSPEANWVEPDEVPVEPSLAGEFDDDPLLSGGMDEVPF
jgi:hypothetical protein